MSDETPAPGSAKTATLFLSYARPDKAKAASLAAALGRAGYEIWWDDLIAGGAAFAKSIDEALARADAVLVLWSQQSIGSDWVRDEAAVGRDRHCLVPLSLDGAHAPLGFRQYQTIDLSHWRGDADANEIDAVTRGIAALGHAPRTPPAAGRRRWSRRTMLIGGAGAGVIAVGGAALIATRLGRFADGADRNGIAVLPFRNLSADTSQAYFAEGLAEEVRAALRRVPSLQVVAAASSEAAAAGQDDVRTIARKLGVAYLLEGSVQRAGAMLRIAVDLSDGATGFSRWSNSVDRPMTDVFAVESEIAAMVANAMQVHAAPARAAAGGTANVAAYEHFLHGRALFNLGKDEATDRAGLAEYDAALTLDPRYARAHAGRSRSLAAIASEYASADQLAGLNAEAVRAAQRAIDLAPALAEGQLAMGFVLYTGLLEIARARPFYDRAYALAHGNADIALLFGLYCSRAGRAGEAAAAVGQAVTLDPLNPRAHRAQGSIRYAARQYRAALAPLRRAVELNPSLNNAHSLIGFCLMLLGDLPGAAKEFAAESHDAFRLAGLAIVRRRAGDEAGAKQAFGQLVSGPGDGALYQQAQVLAQWGDANGALAALMRAREVSDSGLVYLATDPMLDPVRGAPEFSRLLKQMGFT